MLVGMVDVILAEIDHHPEQQEGPIDQDCKVVKEPELSVQVANRSSCSNTSDEKKTGRLRTRFDMLPLTSIQRAWEVNNEEQLIPKNSKFEGLLEAKDITERGM